MRYAPLARSTQARAESWVGRAWPPGWCLAWLLRHVYGLPTNIESAALYHDLSREAGVLVEHTDPATIPAGAIIVWSGEPGHVAYSLGNGRMVSTDLPDLGTVGEVDVTAVIEAWGLELIGYTLVSPSGHELTREPAPEPQLRFLKHSGQPVYHLGGDRARTLSGVPVTFELHETVKRDPHDRHRVVKVVRATVYDEPGGTVVAHLQRGDVVQVLAQQTIDGTSWLRITGGGWLPARTVRKP